MEYPMEDVDKNVEEKHGTKPEMEIEPRDGGWGWVVCFAAFMTNFTVIGMLHVNGFILSGLLELFNESVSRTSLVVAVFAGVTMFGGPFVNALLARKASHRQIMILGGTIGAASTIATAFAPGIDTVIFTYGILAGFPLAMNYFAANIILGWYFNKKRAIATGIANSGTGFGHFALTFFAENCIPFYGMRGTFLLIGGLYLNLIVYGALCRPLRPVIKSIPKVPGIPQSTSEDSRTTPETLTIKSEPTVPSCYCDRTIYQNKTFLLLLAIYLSWGAGYALIVNVPAYAESVGLSRKEGAMVLSILGIVLTISQILVGFLADILHIPISYLLFFSMFGMSVSIIGVSFCQTFATLVSSVIVFSIGLGFSLSLRIVLIAAVLGIEKLSEANSLMTIIVGIGYIVYPYICGLIYDATNSFPIVFYVISSIIFLGTILSFGVIYSQKKGHFAKPASSS